MFANSNLSEAIAHTHVPARVVDWMVSGLRSLAHRRMQRRAITHLRGLDDHTLRDIGIHRSEIESVVRGRRSERKRFCDLKM